MFARPIRPTFCAGIQRHWVASTTKVWVKPGHVAWGQCTMWCCCRCSSMYVWCIDYNSKLRAWIILLGLRCLIFLTTHTVLVCCVRHFCHANGVIKCFTTFSISWCPCIYLIMAPDTMAALGALVYTCSPAVLLRRQGLKACSCKEGAGELLSEQAPLSILICNKYLWLACVAEISVLLKFKYWYWSLSITY